MLKFAQIISSLLISVSLSVADPLIVAHRGASGNAPENTISAFKLAWKQGADAIEGDFRLTKDGHIVCIHDKDTLRVSGKKWSVKDSSLHLLRQLDVGVRHGQKFKDTRIPTIEEVFATIPKYKKIFIEIKTGSEIIQPLLREIKKSKLTNDQIMIICFDPNVLLDLKRRAPHLKTMWLISAKKDPSGIYTLSNQLILATAKIIKANGLSISAKRITKQDIESYKQLGYECHTWTINQVSKALTLKKWGVRSITTDYPRGMKKALNPTQKDPLLSQ